MNKKYLAIIIGAFLLEAAGYVAFPYISLRLRDGFGLPEKEIGAILLVAVWLRPVWAVLGGYLSERVRPFFVFALACLAEGLCFLLLGTATSAALAACALILGNLGFSIWSPNLFALVYNLYDKAEVTAKISLLTGAMNAGAAAGCLAGALFVGAEASGVFVGAAALYFLSIPLLGSVLYSEPVPSRAAATAPSDERPATTSRTANPLLTLAVIVTTFGFWASYSQFASFFALFANDWIGANSLTGIAFGGVAVLVAVFSVILSKARAFQERLAAFVGIAALLLGASWLFQVARPGKPAVAVFIVMIALAESLFTVYLADLWTFMKRRRATMMQSLNFAVRAVAMGTGSLIGGYFYHHPRTGASLAPWGAENAILLALSLAGMIAFLRVTRRAA